MKFHLRNYNLYWIWTTCLCCNKMLLKFTNFIPMMVNSILFANCWFKNKSKMIYLTKYTICVFPIFASQGLRFGSPFSPPLSDLEYILRIRTLIFHWLRLPVHVSNQKTFYTDHMLSFFWITCFRLNLWYRYRALPHI
jgi:hypothetical protein